MSPRLASPGIAKARDWRSPDPVATCLCRGRPTALARAGQVRDALANLPLGTNSAGQFSPLSRCGVEKACEAISARAESDRGDGGENPASTVSQACPSGCSSVWPALPRRMGAPWDGPHLLPRIFPESPAEGLGWRLTAAHGNRGRRRRPRMASFQAVHSATQASSGQGPDQRLRGDRSGRCSGQRPSDGRKPPGQSPELINARSCTNESRGWQVLGSVESAWPCHIPRGIHGRTGETPALGLRQPPAIRGE